MLLIMWLKWKDIHNNDLSWWNVITKHCYLIVDRSVNILGLKPEILLVGKSQKVAVKNNCIANKAYTYTLLRADRLCSPCHSKIILHCCMDACNFVGRPVCLNIVSPSPDHATCLFGIFADVGKCQWIQLECLTIQNFYTTSSKIVGTTLGRLYIRNACIVQNCWTFNKERR